MSALLVKSGNRRSGLAAADPHETFCWDGTHIDTFNIIKAYFIRHKIKYGYALTKNLFVEYKKNLVNLTKETVKTQKRRSCFKS